MANQGRVNFGIGFNVDKSGLNNLKRELQNLINLNEKDLIKINADATIKDLNEIQNVASRVSDALEKSFNPKLNTTDLTKFKQELNGLGIDQIKAAFDKAGQSGQNAFRNISVELLTTNKNLKETSQYLNKMADTLSNTVRWSVASSALNAITGSVQKAWSFTKQLDSSLNDIQIVTGKSADEMDRFAVKATKAAQALGATTRSYSDAALIYYQQGLSETDVQARAGVTTKVANVTGQNAQEVSEQLTAVWNGYKVSAQEAELYIDKLSAVAATTAADLEELSVGMSRVASAANIMGVDIDQLNAQVATVVSVTREAPESIGTALKTVYARMSDIESGLDTETTLGEYTEQMKQMGINVLDAQGNLRDMGAVVEEIGDNWNNLSRNQQTALAQTIAGTRQYSRMMALFDNWDMYQAAKSTSEGGAGELQKQQDIYMESMKAHLNELTSEAEELYQTLMDPEGLNPLIDSLTTVVGLVENMIEGLGGGAGLLRNIGAIGFNVFGNQISQGASRVVKNVAGLKENIKLEKTEAEIMKEYDILAKDGQLDERQQELVNAAKARFDISDRLSEEEKERTKELIKQTNEIFKQQDALNEQYKETKKLASSFGDTSKEREEAIAEFKNTKLEEDFSEIANSTREVFGKQKRVEIAHNASENYFQAGLRANKDNNLEKSSQQEQMMQEALEEEAIQQEKLDEARVRQAEVLKDYSDRIVVAVENVNSLAQTEKHLGENSRLTQEQQEKLANIMQRVNAAYGIFTDDEGKEFGKVLTNNASVIEDANIAIKEYNDLIDEVSKAAAEANKNLPKLEENIEKINQTAEEGKDALKNLEKGFKLEDIVGKVVDTTGAIMNLTSATMTLIELPSIWSNEDLTTGEKLLQTITSIGFALPMIVSGFKQINDTFKISEIFTKENIKSLFKKAAAEKVAAEATEDHAKAEKKQNNAINNDTPDLDKETAENLQEAGQSLTKKGKKKFSLKGKGGGIAAGAIAGALTAMITTFAIVDSFANAEKKAFEASEKAAKAAQERVNQISAAYDKLNNSVKNLTSAQQDLEKLTQGTIEWQKALFDVNSQVTQLLTDYPELSSYVTRDAQTGALSVSDKGLEVIQKKQLEEMQKAQIAAIDASQIAMRDEAEYRRDEWAQSTNNTDAKNIGATLGAGLAGAGVGAALGATIGSAVPVLGTIIGAVAGLAIGGITGWVTGAVNQNNEEKAKEELLTSKNFDLLLERYKTDGENILASEDALSEALYDNKQALTDVEKALIENKEETKALIEATIKEREARLAQDTARYTQDLIAKGYTAEQASILGGMIASNVDTDQENADIGRLTEYYKKRYGNNKELIQDWARSQGFELDKEDISETGGGNFKYKDAEGKEQKVSYETLAKQLATASIKNANTSYANVVEAEKKLNAVIADAEEDTAKILKQILSTNKEINAQNFEFNNKTIQELRDRMSDIKNLSDEARTALETTIKSLENYKKNIANIEGWGEGVQQAVNNLFNNNQEWDNIFEKFSSSFVAKAGASLSKFENFGGADSLNAAASIFSSLGAKNTEELFKNIDLSSATLLEDFTRELDSMGVALDYTSEEGFQFAYALAKANGEMVASQENWAKTLDILKSLTAENKEINEEQYASLIKSYGSAISDYFVQMEDGTYRLTTAAGSFNKAIRELEKDKAQNAIDEATESIKNYAKTLNDALGKAFNQEGERRTEKGATATTTEDILNSTSVVGKYSIGSNNDYVQRLTSDMLRGNKFDSQKEAVSVLNAYLQTEQGKNLKDALVKMWGDMDTWTNNTWKSIVDETGGTNVLIDLFNDASSIDKGVMDEIQQLAGVGTDSYTKTLNISDIKSTVLNDIVAKENAGKDTTDKTYLERSAVAGWLQGLLGQGIITQTQYDEWIKRNESDGERLLSSEDAFSAPLLADVKKAISANEASTQQLRDSLLQAAKLSDSEEELNKFFENNEANFNLLDDKEAKSIKEEALASVKEKVKIAQKEAARATDVLKKDFGSFLKELYAEEDDFFKRTEQNLIDFEDTIDSIGRINKEIEELNEEEANGGNTQEERLALVQELQQKMLDAKNIQLEIDQERLGALEAIASAYEDQLGYLNQANELLQQQYELQNLIYGENSQRTGVYYSNQLTNIEKQEDRLAKQIQDITSTIVYDSYGAISSINGYDQNSKWYKQELDKYIQLNNDYGELILNKAQVIKDQWMNTITIGIEEMKNSMGAAEMEIMERRWEWISGESKKYYDTIDAAYELQKLQSDFDKRINNTANTKTQEKLIKMRDATLKSLKEQNKLSESDLKMAQEKLAILEAEIALRDAENAKTQMRLVRGADGSYGYQYVADVNAIEEARQKYEEAKNNYYNSFKDTFTENVDEAQSLLEDYFAKLQEFGEGGYDSAEQNDLELLWERYANAAMESKESVEQFKEDLADLGMSEEDIEEMLQSFGVYNTELGQTYANMDINSLSSNKDKMFNALKENGASVSDILQVLGSEYEKIYAASLKGLDGADQAAQSRIDRLNTEMSAIDDTKGKLNELIQEYERLSKTTLDYSKNVLAGQYLAQGMSAEQANEKAQEIYTLWKPGEQFDTGGYTGDWNTTSGRLAMLHQKELVLNADDTSNFLDALEILRSLNLSMLNSVAQMGRGYDLSMAAWELAKEMVIEQNVHISAEFPNATNHSEIEEAFENIINLASQHAYKVKI